MNNKSLLIAILISLSGTFNLAYAGVKKQTFNFDPENCNHYCNS